MWLPQAAEPMPDLLGHTECQKAPPEYRRIAQHRLQPTTSLLPQRTLRGATGTIFHGHCLWHGTKAVPLVKPKNGSNSALHPPFRNGGESLDRRHLTGTPIRLTAYPETRGPRRRQKPPCLHRSLAQPATQLGRGYARVGRPFQAPGVNHNTSESISQIANFTQ